MTELQSIVTAFLAVGGAAGILAIVKAIHAWKVGYAEGGEVVGYRAIRQEVPILRAPPPPPPPGRGVPVADARTSVSQLQRQVETWVVGARSLQLQIEVDQFICKHNRYPVVLSDETVVGFVCEHCWDVEENLAWLACNDMK